MPLGNPIPNAPRTFSLKLRQRAENRYRRLLNSLLKFLEDGIKKAKTPEQLVAVLKRIISSAKYNELCREAARQVVTMLAVGQKRTWKEAARASSKGRQIYKALMTEMTETRLGQAMSAIVSENAKLIKTVSGDLAERFSFMAEACRMKGMRSDEIVPEIMKQAPHLRLYQAKRIARTETSKASTALIRARAESIGCDWYVWHSCEDERVRESHRNMEGVLCRWSDPPDPEKIAGEKSYGNYDPGGIFNCRCVPLVVVDVESIKFPCRVHVSGSIIRIPTLKAFLERFDAA